MKTIDIASHYLHNWYVNVVCIHEIKHWYRYQICKEAMTLLKGCHQYLAEQVTKHNFIRILLKVLMNNIKRIATPKESLKPPHIQEKICYKTWSHIPTIQIFSCAILHHSNSLNIHNSRHNNQRLLQTSTWIHVYSSPFPFSLASWAAAIKSSKFAVFPSTTSICMRERQRESTRCKTLKKST